MPETIGNENAVSPKTRRQNERTEARFFEDGNKVIAETESVAAGEYQPPNSISTTVSLKTRRDASLAQRGIIQTDDADEEAGRNNRENLYKQMDKDLTRLVGYAKSAGKKENEIAALESISNKIKGVRAETIAEDDTNRHISVSNRAYVSRADNYSRFVEAYDALEIETSEDFYKADTHRDKAAEYQTANNRVITAEAKSNASQSLYDQITYTGDDSYLNALISSKEYFKSKFKDTHYKNIAKTRFVMPSRLRKKK
ncbi:MAG: hypothetical protein WA584_16735 [Pyrinomonadaceae bacterium]